MELGQKKFNIILIVLFIVVSSLIVLTSFKIKDNKTKQAMEDKYISVVQKIQSQTKILIENKKYSTLSIAMSLAKDPTIKQAIIDNNPKKIKLKEFSQKLREHTYFKNVWFSIITKDSKCFYRSWIDEYGDTIGKNEIEIIQLLKKPKIKSVISVNKFDLVFKSIIPIYDKDEFLGLFQVITHFNSVARRITTNGFNPVVLVDKKYKDHLVKPFTNLFIGDYYVANLGANKNLMDIIKNNRVNSFLNSFKDYQVDYKNHFLKTTYYLKDDSNNNIGYILLFKSLDTIKIDDIKSLEQNIIFFMIAIIVVIAILGYYFSNRRLNQSLANTIKQVRHEEAKIKSVIAVQPSIIVLTDGKSIQEANPKFFKFFQQFKNLQEFKKEYNCICDFFVKNNDTSLTDNKNDIYIYENIIDGKSWTDYIIDNQDKTIKTVMVDSENKSHYFIIKVKETNTTHDKFVVATFIDITNEIENTKKIFEQEKQMFESAKMASLGEMIGNIAHQWRQPLSAITTAASGLQVQKDFRTLSDEEFKKFTDGILRNGQFLSETIDTFRDFIKEKKESKSIILQDRVDRSLDVILASLENNQIQLIKDIDYEHPIKMNIVVGELSQVIINIINNSKDILIENAVKEPWIKVILTQQNNKAIISIEDNGGGIPDDIISKIFEPYFTTKHQSQGTGLGLHMSYEIVTQSLNGKIYAQNTKSGAKSFIEIPIK